jgi:hypothetical protein
MPTTQEMTTSLEDARFFNDKIEKIVRGPQSGHDLTVVRRYFHGYLHCWKTVLHLVRAAKGLDSDEKKWVQWCQRWQAKHLDADSVKSMDQLRETRDYDTHAGTSLRRWCAFGREVTSLGKRRTGVDTTNSTVA